MANPEHLRILRKGVQAWKLWREANPAIEVDLSAADLRGMNLRGVNLAGAILSGANLSRAGLHDANLSEAHLYRAVLLSACLEGANLRRANLNAASLGMANLCRANLDEALLTSTDLISAKLCEATLRRAAFTETTFCATDLRGSCFAEARFMSTKLADLDLSNASGLETVLHLGRSSVGIDTLYRSRGQISESFLRGCGIPEEFIRYFPALVNQPIEFYSCFISHSHEDKAFARLLYGRLQGQGIRCWLDEHQLLPGDDLHEGIDQGIRRSDKVLLCASKPSLTSWWVDGEINRAFQKEAQIMKERGKKTLALIPLNLDGFLFSADYQSGKKAEITSRVAANFVGWEKDPGFSDREVERVIRALRTDEGRREEPPPASL